MSDLKIIKQRIYDEERIPEILDKLGCRFIKSENRGKLFTASLPDGNNRRSVQVKNTESLTSNIRSKGIRGDIYALVSFIINDCKTEDEIHEDLNNAKRWIIDELGYHDVYDWDDEPRTEQNGWLKGIKKKRKKQESVVKPNSPIGEDVKEEFFWRPYYGWIEEGISARTQWEFEVAFDRESRRVVYMVRDKEGQLIGVKGRTIDPKEAEERKYLYLYRCNKSIELYNLHKAYQHILERKEVIVFESAKSCMKAYQYGFPNCVSIEGDDISDFQVRLLKEFGMEIKIVLAFDKDKDKIWNKEQASKLTNRLVYIVYDEWKVLKEKDSPVDRGKNIWEKLFKRKKRFIA